MKKTRFISLALSFLTALQLVSVSASASEKPTYVPVSEPVESGNVFVGGALDSEADAANWSANGQKLEAKIEGDIEYLAASGITVNYVGFTYKPGVTLQPGEYKFSCKVRTSVKGDTTSLRVVNGIDNTQNFATVVGDWTEITFNFNVSSASEFSFKICGGMQAECIQPYDISDINLTKVG